MYIQNKRNTSKSSGCSPLQLYLGLIGLRPAIAEFAYNQRLVHKIMTKFQLTKQRI